MRAEILKFPSSLTVYEVQQYASDWQAISVRQPEKLELDLSDLQELDAAGYQLVLSLLKGLPNPELTVRAGSDSHLIAAWLADQLSAQGYSLGGMHAQSD
ncbi:hypothetical protein [Rheinheimera tilapiae]|uniref:STAS domain-containing protein n=1 Tax=Rheinheimera tilapiae TaxID=875043 RepID=A0ABV6BBR3_9GAMM